MSGIGKTVMLVVLVATAASLGFGGYQIYDSVLRIMNCGGSCFDIEQTYLSLGIKDPQKLTIVLLFVFRNPSALSACIVDLPFKVELAGTQIGQSRLVGLPLLVAGNGRTEATGMIQLPFSEIPSVALNSVKQYMKEGSLKYRISGKIALKIVLFGVIVPFLPEITTDFDKQGVFP